MARKNFAENTSITAKISGGVNKIIYLAAYHHPDLVEKNPHVAWDVNVTALSRFLNLAEGVDRFLYPSTDSVYGESVKEYKFKETDSLTPPNRYGIQKSCAEKLVTAYGYHVVRYPFLIGHSISPGKKHFYDTIVETISQGNAIDMFSDSYRSALDFDTAARLTVDIMEKPAADVPQILNVCGDEALSKYEIGLRLAGLLGVPQSLVRPVSIQNQTDIFTVRRASSTLMDNTLMKRILGADEVKINLSGAKESPYYPPDEA
nr:sugar nucleotide-binding protein [uncultured Dysosmobacter sp.]